MEALIQERFGAENAKTYTLVMEDTLNQPPAKYTLFTIASSLGCKTLHLRVVECTQLIPLYVYPIERIEERRAGAYPVVYSSLVCRNAFLRDTFKFVKMLAPSTSATQEWYMWGYIEGHMPPDPRFEVSGNKADVIANFYKVPHLEVVAYHK